MTNEMHEKKTLVVATTYLCTDGLTEVLIRIAESIHDQYKVDFALGAGAEEDIITKLQEYGTVYRLPDRKRHPQKYSRELTGLTGNEAYDIVHIHGNSATMALDLTGCLQVKRRITHCHNQARQPMVKKAVMGTMMNRLVTDPVACSQSAGKALYTKPFTVIRNGINTERFQFSDRIRQETRAEYGLQNAFAVGHIGRFSEQKNHERLIRIFEKVLMRQPKARLLLCGGGELEGRIREIVQDRRLEDRILFAGVVSNPEKYLMAMDVLVLPSLFEGLPLVGVEAQATGLPCVFADTITEEAAILPEVEFLPLDETDDRWAEVICKDRKTHREAAAKQVEEAGYGMDTVREQIRKLYRSAWSEND